MPLQLLPLEESDLSAYEEIAWQAFKEDGLMGLMYPNGFSQAALDSSVDWSRIQFHRQGNKVKLLKVIDTDLPENDPYNKIVGVSKWKVYPTTRTEAEIQEEQRQDEEEPMPPGVRVELVEEFFGTIHRLREQNLGTQPHVLLEFLATLPDHRRRGVGAMHLQWGSEKADELGLPCYLESSPMGKPLYERNGYKFVSDFPFDAKKWGSKVDLQHICMKRPPQNGAE